MSNNITKISYGMNKYRRGFTLVDLILTVAIIAILSVVTVTWIGSARAKSRDSKALRELQEVRTALSLYQEKYGRYPNETPITSNPYKDNFADMAQELVQEGFLSRIPAPPAGRDYQYYNYGPNNDVGALLITTLEKEASTGYSGSCRPWPSGGANWCTTDESNYYCLCNSY